MRAPRPFTLADAMILVAAAGVGLGGASRCAAYEVAGGRPSTLFSLILSASCLLAIGSAGVMILGLRHPRPPLRRLAFRPGFSASVAVIAAVACNSLILGKGFDFVPASGALATQVYRLLTGIVWPWSNVAAIAAVWSVIALGGRWRPEPDWIDRLGRLLAGLWFVAAAWLAWLAD